MSSTFTFYQCQNPQCDFRFPAPAESITLCPRCNSALTSSPPVIHESAPLQQPPKVTSKFEVLLDNIRSVLNVGSMFRTADGAGVSHMHLGGITATPDHPRIAKTGLGAEWSLPWTYHANGVKAAAQLISNGAVLWGLETSPDSIPIYSSGTLPKHLVMVVGSEYAGIDPAIQALCQKIVFLPMAGYKRSLNVAVAFGIAVYALRYQLNYAAK